MSGKNEHWGSTLDDFLHEEGICEAAKVEASIRVSEILDVAHEMAQDLFRAGIIDEITLREVESLCLPSKRLPDLVD